MTRPYTLRKRAERQQETHRRIAEAALDLHSTVGPAHTTVSAIAERAGVQRHTFYRHFPSDLELFAACSGLHAERDPFPDPQAWESVADAGERLRLGLAELYAYYERNERLLANVIRDAEAVPAVAEAVARRLEWMRRASEILAQPFGVRGRRRDALTAALEVATSFHTWATLARSGLSSDGAVDLMARMVECAASKVPASPSS